MSDLDGLTQFTLTGLESAIVADTTDAGSDLDAVGVRVAVTITPRPEIVHLQTTPPRICRLRPVKVRIEGGVLVLPGGVVGAVRLVADTAVLGLEGHLLYDVKFGKGVIAGDEVDFSDQNFTFAAATTDVTVDIAEVVRLSGNTPAGTALRMVPDHVRLNVNGDLVFSANGIDIPDPLDIAEIDVSAAIAAAVTAAMAALVAGAPGALDTLNELAAALGDDPNFATTIATALGNRQPLDADLTAIAALTSAANKLPYSTGAGAWALADLTALARTLVASADEETAKTSIGLPVFAAATWTKTADFQAEATRPALVMIGDSISDNDQVITTWNGSSGSRTNAFLSIGYLTCAMVWNRQQATWIDRGVGGQTAAQCLARFDTDVTAYRPQVVLEASATNSIATNVTAAVTFATKLAMWRKAWTFGAKVIATTCPPRNTFTDTQEQEAHKLNALLRNFAATNPANFALVDWFAALADPLTGNYRTDYTTDGVHPHAGGAWAMGKAFEAALDRFLPAAVPNLAAANVNDLDNLLTNPLMTGTAGTLTSNKGLTGPLATGWGATSTGTDATLTSVLSQVSRPDGYGNWQQVNTTVLPTSTGYVQINRGIASGFAVGDIVQACVEFETDAGGWSNGVFDMLMTMVDASSNLTQVAGSFTVGNSETIVQVRPESGILQTPSVVIPTATTFIQISINIGGLGVARIGRPAIRKLAVAP